MKWTQEHLGKMIAFCCGRKKLFFDATNAPYRDQTTTCPQCGKTVRAVLGPVRQEDIDYNNRRHSR